MKKALVFLLLFGGGLLVLYFLQDREKKDDPAPPGGSEIEEPRPGPGPGEGTEPGVPIPIDPENGERGGAQVIASVSGKTELTRFGEYYLRTENFRPQPDGTFLADDVLVRMYEPDTTDVRAILEARLGDMSLESDDRGRLIVARSRPIRLDGVELEILKGAPIVPVNFTVPVLDWSMADQRFESEDHILLTSPGLQAESTGLIATTAEGSERITLVRNGVIELELDDGRLVKLEATGISPIVLSRVPGTGERTVLRLTVDDGALLTLQDGTRLEARSLDVEGERKASTGGASDPAQATFLLTSARASGQVRVSGDPGVVTGSEVVMEFDSAGRPELAVVTGEPEADLLLGPKLADGTLDRTKTTRVLVDGRGPMRVAFSAERRRFEIEGPATATLPDQEVTLRAQDWLRGSLDREDDHRTLLARGAVEVELESAKLHGPELRLEQRAGPDALELFEVELLAPSRFEGTEVRDDHTRDLRIDATGTIVARGERDPGTREARLFLDRADGVNLSFESTHPDHEDLVASAARLIDFDVEARRFVAEGGVSGDIAGGSAKAQRIVAHSDRDVEFFGTPDEPATFTADGSQRPEFDAEDISASAGYLRVREGEVSARDHVELALSKGERTLRMGAAEVVVTSPAGELPRPYEVHARGVTRAGIVAGEEELAVSCEQLDLTGELVAGEKADEVRLGAFDLDARGGVRVDLRGKERDLVEGFSGTAELTGYGESFTWSLTQQDLEEAEARGRSFGGRGRLSTLPGERVRSVGRLAGERLPYEMTADWIEFGDDRVEAHAPRIEIDSDPPAEQGEQDEPDEQAVRVFEAWGDSLVATPSAVLLTGRAHVAGVSDKSYPWSLDASEVELALDPGGATTDFRSVEARGGFTATFNNELTGTGERLILDSETLRLEGTPAVLAGPEFAWQSSWIEFEIENEIVTTGPGEILPSADAQDDWTIRYESLQPFNEREVTVLALRNAVVSRANQTLRSNWALFWIDNEEWSKAGNPLVEGGETELRTDSVDVNRNQDPPPADPNEYNLFRSFETGSIARLLNEIYVEGDVEYLVDDERLVRAEAIYIDLIDGHSWIQEANLKIPIPGDNNESLRVNAEWVRHSSDGSLRAESATMTSCDHDVPHYVIETGDLKMTPAADGDPDVSYTIAAERNAIRLQNGLAMYLPSLSIDRDTSGDLIYGTATIGGLQLPNVSFGDSARFGTELRTQFSRGLGDVGKAVAKGSEKALDLEEDSVDGRWRYNAAWFGSRGVLVGIGLEITNEDDFWLKMYADGIPDRRRDRGLVRVPEADRDTFRGWYRARGRYTLDDDEWIDLRYSQQSDAGVQAEFFERDFLGWEERENFLHWRKADDQFYYAANVEERFDRFLTETVEQPTVKWKRGRTPITMVGGAPLLYSFNADVEYLKRYDGNQEDPFADSLGDRQVARFDNTHRLELPLNLSNSGLRLTPFLEGRLTAWSENQLEDDEPLRAAAFAGAELSLALWKRLESGALHTLTPKASVRFDMDMNVNGGTPVFFDEVENPIDGRFFDLGTRSVLRSADGERFFDVDLTATHADDVAPNLDGWSIATYSQLRQFLGRVPVGFTHDGRYDLEDGNTLYSNSFVGVEPFERVGIEMGYHSARDQIEERLYEAASIAARFTATRKWEFEFRQTFDLDDSDELVTAFLIRRYGHDLVFELEFRQREGEGAGFSIGIDPRIGWRRSSLGLLDNWKRRGSYY